MTTISIEISSCKQCPFWKQGPRESTDGFDSGNDWICTKIENGKIIEPFVEWHEVNKVKIPKWCPFN